MPIVAPKRNSKQYEIPDEGLHMGVVADVIDLGEVQTDRGAKNRVRIIYVLESTDRYNNNFQLQETFNLSMYAESHLAKRVKSLTGAEQSEDYDLEQLIGISKLFVVVHNGQYANIGSVLRVPKDKQSFSVPADFAGSRPR